MKERKKRRSLEKTGAFKRMMGIEPTSQAWEARILPMNYTRNAWSIIYHRCLRCKSKSGVFAAAGATEPGKRRPGQSFFI